MRPTAKTTSPLRKRTPFWLPASSFYFLVAGFAAASFFLIIGIFNNEAREPEIVVAGLVASGVLVSGVVLRELILRHARERFLKERRNLDSNLKTTFARINDESPRKLTLERNAAAIRAITIKSEAAMMFERIAEGHREVFEMCAEYRSLVAKEMRTIHPNSPRLKALIKGNDYALQTHKFHILRWAELESKALANQARQSKDLNTRAEFAVQAKHPLELALNHYPEEAALRESLDVLDAMLLQIQLKHFMNEAEFALLNGDRGAAEAAYENALAFLDRNGPVTAWPELREEVERALTDLQRY